MIKSLLQKINTFSCILVVGGAFYCLALGIQSHRFGRKRCQWDLRRRTWYTATCSGSNCRAKSASCAARTWLLTCSPSPTAAFAELSTFASAPDKKSGRTEKNLVRHIAQLPTKCRRRVPRIILENIITMHDTIEQKTSIKIVSIRIHTSHGKYTPYGMNVHSEWPPKANHWVDRPCKLRTSTCLPRFKTHLINLVK